MARGMMPVYKNGNLHAVFNTYEDTRWYLEAIALWLTTNFPPISTEWKDGRLFVRASGVEDVYDTGG